VTVRRRVASRAAVAIGLRDYMFHVLDNGRNSVALTVGLTLR
jgi:hypothetical protein